MTAANGTVAFSFECRGRGPAAVLDLLPIVPATSENPSDAPRERAQAIARSAALKAATVAAALSLPPGPFAWLTVPLELVSIWRIQAQMVADIAGAYGRSAVLSRELVLQCVFARVVTQTGRDVAIRVGQRALTHRFAFRLIESAICRVGISIGSRAVARRVTRVVPLLGAASAAFCARLDTQQVAAAAVLAFERDAHELATARELISS